MAGVVNHDQANEIEIDIVDILRDIIKDWWLVILVGLTAAMCSYIIVNVIYQPEYSASATFVVTSKGSNNTYANLSATNMVASSLTNIFDSDVLKKKVVVDIGAEKIPGSIYAEVIPETNLFVLTAYASSPDMAFRIITSIMKNYTSVTDHVFGNAILDVLEAPKVPMYPDNPLDMEGVMKMSFIIGFAAMAVILGGLSILRDNIKNEKEIKDKLDTKLFGVIYHEHKYKTLGSRFRKLKKSILITSPSVSFSFVENYKKMRTKLEYKATQKSHKVLLVTSVLENEGKSTVAANLAIALAQKENKVLLIDGDFYNPSVHKVLQKRVPSDEEIGDCILHNDIEEALTYDMNSGLYLAMGSKRYKNSMDLILDDAFREFIGLTKKVMDYVVIDAPPLSKTADTEVLADLADASLLVVRQSKAYTKDINDAIDVLSDSNSELLGCVFNNVRTTLFGRGSVYGVGYGHGYEYKYGYGYGHEKGYGSRQERGNGSGQDASYGVEWDNGYDSGQEILQEY